MDTEAVTLLFALLAVGAELVVVSALALGLLGRRAPTLAAGRDRLVALLAPDALVLALVVALVATLGSLYLSEVADFRPCRLCWVQRAFMYPLVPVLAMARWRGARWIRVLALVLATGGGSVAVYHVLLERFPSLEGSVCDPTNPCTLIWVERLGYLTIPAMALSAFALIVVLVVVSRGAGDLPRQTG